MSLYALPGPLFAPLQQMNHHHPQPSKAAVPKQRVLVDFSKVEISRTLRRTHSGSSNTDNSEITSSTATSTSSCSTASMHDQHLKLRVKEAKLDFHKLARPSRASKILSSCQRQPNGRLQRRRQEANKATAAEQQQLSSHENALAFELEISFVGRTYTTKRSLQQILQLRQDLMQDLEWTERRCNNKKKATLFLDDSSNCSMDDSSSTTSSSSTIIIPDLPRMSDEGTYGCGFAQMGGMLQSYRPSLEGWFHQVVAHVSEDHPILADFLWEPLSSGAKGAVDHNQDELHLSLAELGPIDE